MSDREIELSRRKILGSIGAVGAAGALGGAATNALLWDEEVFGSASAPNILQAGKLDLKADWTEHYYDAIGTTDVPGPDGTTERSVSGTRMITGAEDLEEGEVGLPTPDAPILAVDGESLEDFMAATVTEESGPTDVSDPVITITDVKPGDFGEVTLSYHLEGNPGFVSLCADELADDDFNSTEPELSAGDAEDNLEDDFDGELGTLMQAAAWYDPNCDNLFSGGEVEVMLVTDVSESMNDPFSGTPDVDDNSGDGQTGLEAIKGAIGDHGGSGFLSNLESAGDCAGSVEIGTVSASQNLPHLDDLGNGDDSPPGNDGGDLQANLDKALGAVGGSDYGELKDLYGTGTDFSPDFVTDDPDNTNYEAERPYTEDGGSTVPDGVQRAHRALLPDGFTGPSSTTGIDPSGNADDPGTVRKLMVVLTDGKPGEADSGFAQAVSDDAEQDGIDILPIIVNDNPVPDDVAFAENLATTDMEPLFATQYDGTPSSCPSSVTSASHSCVSLTDAMSTVRASICASAGGEGRIAGPGPISDVLGALDSCVLLEPSATGASVSGEYEGTACHEAGSEGCVALAWWLPRDVPGVNDNVVETDRYEFTVGFDAVQCRHNVADDGGPIDDPGDAEASAAD